MAQIKCSKVGNLIKEKVLLELYVSCIVCVVTITNFLLALNIQFGKAPVNPILCTCMANTYGAQQLHHTPNLLNFVFSQISINKLDLILQYYELMQLIMTT
jgi:hypothetical protein